MTSRSIRRRGSIIEIRGARGTSYKLKFDAPGHGERRTIYKTLKNVSRDEAEAELAKLIEKVGQGVDVHAGKCTLAVWVEAWLSDYSPDVSTRTLERYAQLLRGHVVPGLGERPLAVLTTMDIERFYKRLNNRLAPRTISHVHRTLYQCLKDARRLKLIAENPAQDARRKRIETKTKMHVLKLKELLALFDHVKTAQLKSVSYELVLLAFDSGARRGELTAARWSNLDMEKRTLRIERAVDETQAHGIRIKDEPKNSSSIRTIRLSTQTVAALRELWKRQAEDRLLLGAHLPDDALIFPRSIETPTVPLRPREVSKVFGRLARQAGFAGFRFHDLRHCCASHALKAGRPVPDVAKHLGHADPSVTMRVYAHAFEDSDEAPGLLEELMEAAQ